MRRLRRLDVTDWLMLAFYAGMGVVVGLAGLVQPSLSATEVLPSRAAVIVWAAIYVAAAPIGLAGRWNRWHTTESVALVMIGAATGLHGVFLIRAGDTGVQTGSRLLAGVLVLAVVAIGQVRLSRDPRKAAADALERALRTQRRESGT